MKEFDICLNRRATEWDIMLFPTLDREEFITSTSIKANSNIRIDSEAKLANLSPISPQGDNTLQISTEVTASMDRCRRLSELDNFLLSEIDNMTLEELDYTTL